MFQGFSPKANEFLWGIRLNNERGWFEAHKQEYLDLVAAPLRELGDEVTQAFGELFPKWGLNLHVSRIYRDARRLHGRGPYKDHMWFVLRRPGESWTVRPAFYFEVAPESYAMGMGCYDAPPAMMARLRARIDQDPKPLEKLARRLNRQDRFRLEGQEYKRPKGDPGPLLYPWYNRKGLALSWEQNWGGALYTPALVQEVVEGFQFLAPYYELLDRLAAEEQI